MTFLDPVWLLLALPAGLSVWLWRPPGRLLVALRLLGLALVLLALAGPALRLPSRAGTLVVVADRSRSMPPGADASQKEVIDILQKAMGPDDRLAVVAFGEGVAVERAPQAGAFAGFATPVGGEASDLGEALEAALALVPRDAPGRVLLLTDGRWTGRDPAAVAPAAAARGVGIDYRSQARGRAGDLAIDRVDAPATVAPGEGFLLAAWVHAPAPVTASFELTRDGRTLAAGERDLVTGLNKLTFRDRAGGPGTQAYMLTVSAPGDDPVPENNAARLLVGVSGPKPLLHVSPSGRSSLAALLRKGGLKVKEATPAPGLWTLENLSRHSAVTLENVEAEKVGGPGMEALAAWVREAGGGLWTTGGRNAYGVGGYYRSPLEPILPVSMELRPEHRKFSVAIVVALDRSGSMAVPVAGGRQKMDLANLGAAQVVDLMGPMDEFGCLAVDTAPHTIARLGPVKDKGDIKRRILGIRSMGGGIYVYEALVAARKMLLTAKAGTKHVLLFADAADAEEPGRYRELLAQCAKDGITVSVIGLGTERDPDAALLRDVAARGKGRVFFTDRPEELPRLFAQDTFVVARNTFLDAPTAVRLTPGLGVLAGRPFPPPGRALAVGGYNLCYLRDGATLATVTEDENDAPLAAAWRVGAGRAVCYTGEADGKYAGALARWDRVGDYYTTLARWAGGPAGGLADGMLLTQEVRGGVARVVLHLDPEREKEPFQGEVRATTLRERPGAAPRATKAALSWAGPDALAAELPLTGGETALTTVAVPGQPPVALPPVCLPYSPEFRPDLDGRGPQTLEQLAGATGGKERVDLTEVWKDLPRRPRNLPVGRWLLLAAVALLLVEVFERRTGLLSRRRRISWGGGGEAAVSAASKAQEPSHVILSQKASLPAVAPPTASPPPEQPGLLEAIRKARQRTRGGGKAT